MRRSEIAVPRMPVAGPLDLTRAPITSIPGETTVLSRFAATGVRRWGAEPIGLPTGLAVAFCALAGGSVVLGGWLLSVLMGGIVGGGWVFAVATLGGHPLPTLLLAAADVASVAGTGRITRGFTRAGPLPLAVLVVGAACGAVALAGAVALLTATALVLGAGLAVVVSFLERA